jgi:hypothetical protein
MEKTLNNAWVTYINSFYRDIREAYIRYYLHEINFKEEDEYYWVATEQGNFIFSDGNGDEILVHLSEIIYKLCNPSLSGWEPAPDYTYVVRFYLNTIAENYFGIPYYGDCLRNCFDYKTMILEVGDRSEFLWDIEDELVYNEFAIDEKDEYRNHLFTSKYINKNGDDITRSIPNTKRS